MSSAGEQRRWPRGTPRECYLRLLVEIPVLVRDVSAGGALLESSSHLGPGSSAQLRTWLKDQPFSPEVLVCRTAAPEPGDRQGQLAIKFGSMDETTRSALTEFLKTAIEPVG